MLTLVYLYKPMRCNGCKNLALWKGVYIHVCIDTKIFNRSSSLLLWCFSSIEKEKEESILNNKISISNHDELLMQFGLFLPTARTVKKVCNFSVPSRDVTDETLPGREKLNYSRPGRVSSVTSRLGTGKQLTLFYSA
jgi:hypothetical protein